MNAIKWNHGLLKLLTLTGVVCCVFIFMQSRKPVLKKPNILFCIADDASMQHMSAYKLSRWVKTPVFDRVAREGVLFTNAYTPNAKCSPSRSAILTGRNPWQLEEAGNHAPYFPAKFTSFMEALAMHEYQVGYTGKGWAPGKPGVRNGKPRMLTGVAYNEVKTVAPVPGISAIDYAANLEVFLKSKPADKPFCFWYGGIEPHRGYTYGSGIQKGKKKLSDIDGVPPYWIDNDSVRTDMLDYGYEVEYFDQQLGKILDVLQQKGELENTIVIVTSDNGMPFPRTKGHVYEYANHLPLAIMGKNLIKTPGRTVDDYVSFIDFAPTILEVAGISVEKAGMQPVEGRSLMNILVSSTNNLVEKSRDHVILGRERNDVGRPGDAGYPVRAIIKNGFMYTRNYEPGRWPSGNPETGYLDTDGSPTKSAILSAHRSNQAGAYWQLAFGKRSEEELYQLAKDPYCINNLATDKSFDKIRQSLVADMETDLKKQADPRMFGQGSKFDSYPYSEERVLHFYERFMRGEKMNADWVSPSDFESKNFRY